MERALPEDRRGQEALLSPSPGPLELPCPNLTFIGKSIRPGGVLLQTSQKIQRGRGCCGPGCSTDPAPFWSARWKRTLRAAVPFDFKGKLEKGNSKSISPKKVRFPLDKKDRASQESVTWALRAACIRGN